MSGCQGIAGDTVCERIFEEQGDDDNPEKSKAVVCSDFDCLGDSCLSGGGNSQKKARPEEDKGVGKPFAEAGKPALVHMK